MPTKTKTVRRRKRRSTKKAGWSWLHLGVSVGVVSIIMSALTIIPFMVYVIGGLAGASISYFLSSGGILTAALYAGSVVALLTYVLVHLAGASALLAGVLYLMGVVIAYQFASDLL